MKRFLVLPILLLTACNSIYIAPGAHIDKNKQFFALRGGYGMRRSVKQAMIDRGYNVIVGRTTSDNPSIESDIYYTSDRKDKAIKADYIVKVYERDEKFNPFWCPFNGFWWWNFNVSIADQKTGTEIMSWRGRGCANSSIRKLNAILDELEEK